MPNNPSYPLLYDNLLKLHIGDLKEYLLKPVESNIIQTWLVDGIETAEISIKIVPDELLIIPKYSYNGQFMKYKVRIGERPSNLKRGKYFYLICPTTGKSCKTLFMIDGIFQHRKAANNAMYKIQTYSKPQREMHRLITKIITAETAEKELHKRKFTPSYNGELTRGYKRILRKLDEGQKATEAEIMFLADPKNKY